MSVVSSIPKPSELKNDLLSWWGNRLTISYHMAIRPVASTERGVVRRILLPTQFDCPFRSCFMIDVLSPVSAMCRGGLVIVTYSLEPLYNLLPYP